MSPSGSDPRAVSAASNLTLDNVGSRVPAETSEIRRIRWHLDHAHRSLTAGDTAAALVLVQDADALLADLEEAA